MSIVNSSNFIAPSERDLKKCIDAKGRYVPSEKQLGISQSTYVSMSDSVMNSVIEYYNAWLTPILIEKRRRKEERKIEKAKNHWFFTLSDEKKKELLIGTLSIKNEVLIRRMMSAGAGEQSQQIYRSAERAEEANFVLKDIEPTKAEKCLPYYDEERDCLYGGDNRFIYCWLKFFPKAPREKKRVNMTR